MIASPFFAVYMLEVLHMDIITFTIVSLTSSIFYLVLSPLAGKFGDKYGNLKLVWIGHVFFILTPLLWLVTKNPLWIIFIPQLSSGIANAASTIAENNFTYDAVRPEKRGVCVSYTNLLIGIGTFVGSILGGLLLKIFPTLTATAFVYLFITAAAVRLLVAMIFLPTLKEVRKTERLPPMHIHLNHPFKSMHSEIGWFHAVFKEKRHK
jgi:MFS family permease